VERAGESIPLIAGRLREAGHKSSYPEQITPSLEDVFVSLIEASERREGEQREFDR
jgi:ABC-2 type transport system ATP-binding protein